MRLFNTLVLKSSMSWKIGCCVLPTSEISVHITEGYTIGDLQQNLSFLIIPYTLYSLKFKRRKFLQISFMLLSAVLFTLVCR
jgi:hypothetical protein